MFHPGGRKESGYCSEQNEAMVWGSDNVQKSLTLKPVIVDEGYMLQFRVGAESVPDEMTWSTVFHCFISYFSIVAFQVCRNLLL